MSTPSEPAPLHPEKLTWAVLLGRWVDFARSALALPPSGEGRRLRDSVPDIVMLQAIGFALSNLEALDPAERALGLDRAQVLIEKHSGALRQRWGAALPPQLQELIDTARARLGQSL